MHRIEKWYIMQDGSKREIQKLQNPRRARKATGGPLLLTNLSFITLRTKFEIPSPPLIIYPGSASVNGL